MTQARHPTDKTPAEQAPAAMTPGDLGPLAEQARAQARAVLHKIPLLGAVAWLMMNQGATRHTLLSELEWRVMPALALDQAKLYMRDEAPVAFVSWAVLSPAVAQRYAGGPHQLTPSDWRSGDLRAHAKEQGQAWIVDLIAPYGGAEQVLEDLRTAVFPDREVRQRVAVDAGASRILTWPAVHKGGAGS